MFRWFDTLGARLGFFVILALVLAQIIGVLTFVRDVERDESESKGDTFVRELAQLVANVNGGAPLNQQTIGTTVQPGFLIWFNVVPAVDEPGIHVPEDGPHIPAQWEGIRSSDKRLEWFPDARPLTTRYSISPVMSMRNVQSGFGARDDAPPSDDPAADSRPLPPAGGADTAKPAPAESAKAKAKPPPRPIDQPMPRFKPPPEDDYGPATTYLTPPSYIRVPPVRWRMAVKLENGLWLNAEYLYERGLPAWMKTVMYQNGVILALMILFVIPGIGFATRRLSELARAADKLGRGEDVPPLAENGTREIRRVTQAFNQMSLRLRRFVQGRTQMLAGISHDLRTPITGLRLRAELVDDEQNRDRMLGLIDDMHHLTEATLRLARDESFTEKSDTIDLSALVGGIADDLADVGIDVSADVRPGIYVMCRPHSLRRAIRNLAENGAKYGQRSRISLEEDAEAVRIMVDDDGPGIPEDKIEKAFQPFVRLEESRSRDTGGSGLGLAITRSIVLNHGGEVILENRPDGGLRATIVLPKSSAA
ncbi:MAG: ATP-binding protein [Rhodospirillaceae bacterium]